MTSQLMLRVGDKNSPPVAVCIGTLVMTVVVVVDAGAVVTGVEVVEVDDVKEVVGAGFIVVVGDDDGPELQLAKRRPDSTAATPINRRVVACPNITSSLPQPRSRSTRRIGSGSILARVLRHQAIDHRHDRRIGQRGDIAERPMLRHVA